MKEPSAAAGSEREAFDKWWNDGGNNVSAYHPHVIAWESWQAARAAAPPDEHEPLVPADEPRFTCAKCGSGVSESYRYNHVCEESNIAHQESLRAAAPAPPSREMADRTEGE